MNKFNLSVLSIALTAAVFSGCSSGTGGKTVARIGWEKITLNDINQRLRNVPMGYREYLMSETGKKQFLDVLVRQKIMIAAAKKAGLDKRKDIKQSIEDFQKDQTARIKQYKDELLVESYLKELEGGPLKIADTESEKYYNEHKREFTHPTEVRLSHILATSEMEADKLIKKLKSGTSFEELAKTSSLDPATSEKAGDLGKFKHTEILPEFLKTVNSLSVGAYSSKAVKTPYGYHILKKTGEKLLPAMSKEESFDEIRKLLLKEKFDKWIDEQKSKLSVKIDYSAFK